MNRSFGEIISGRDEIPSPGDDVGLRYWNEMESSGVGLFEELSEVRSISTFSIQLAYNY